MSITYEDAAKAQTELEDKILTDPNVVSIGVIAETNELGEKTGDYVIKIGIISAEEYQNAVSHGNSLIPKEYILYQRGESQETKCIRIQVVITGKIKALLKSNVSEKMDFPSAVDDILLATYKNQICTTSMSKLGDSGKIQTYASDYSLRILQKRSYSTNSFQNFSEKNMAFVRNFKIRQPKFKAVVAIAIVGLFAVTRKFIGTHQGWNILETSGQRKFNLS